LFAQHGVEVYIKEDYRIHPEISGNKWRKLKYNLLEAQKLGFKKLLTFGGAYSNHLHAVAAAGKNYGFATVGIVRGHELSASSNPTLADAAAWGMELIFVDRQLYKNKETLTEQYAQNCYVLPEGGSNILALKGVTELRQEIDSQIDSSHICVAHGTGTTAVGLCFSDKKADVLAYFVIKGFDADFGIFPFSEIVEQDKLIFKNTAANLRYGSSSTELENFMVNFEKKHQIPLDQVYTGKLLMAVYNDIAAGFFPKKSKIVVVHTGGLQGNRQ
jgi:1-aminocyclopropane-1-carboxylate deaminase